MLQINNTIDENIKTVFNNGEILGEIQNRHTFFEATHVNGTKACFNSFEACKQLFEEVIKPTVKRNNQLNLFN
jgi:hypothetical protein